MALDNAEFISELSIVDPPGTDPLNQGDDHIRTTKKAVQQSFPNVSSAVPQTSAQMAQMAIKNEVNTFTQTNLFQPRQDFEGNLRFLFGIGAQRGPQWRDKDVDQTVWDFVANVATADLSLRRFVGGVHTSSPLVFDQANGQVLASSGTNAVPQYSFQSSPDMGMYRGSAGILSHTTGATLTELGGGVLRFIGPDFALFRLRDSNAALNEKQMRIIFDDGTFSMLTETDAGGGVQQAMAFTTNAGSIQTFTINGQTLDLLAAILKMNLSTGPTGISGQIYAKQSQLFAGTELVLGQTP